MLSRISETESNEGVGLEEKERVFHGQSGNFILLQFSQLGKDITELYMAQKRSMITCVKKFSSKELTFVKDKPGPLRDTKMK